jgi:hypothetical protein
MSIRKLLLHTNSRVSKGDKLKEEHVVFTLGKNTFTKHGPYATKAEYAEVVRGAKCFAREDKFLQFAEFQLDKSLDAMYVKQAIEAELQRNEAVLLDVDSGKYTPRNSSAWAQQRVRIEARIAEIKAMPYVWPSFEQFKELWAAAKITNEPSLT